MKCNDAEKLILLQGSGELAAKRTGSLAMHLNDCLSCRRFQQVLTDSSRVFTEQDEPDLKTMQNVLREARQNTPRRKHAAIWGWKPVLAMASSLVIALGIFFSTFSPDKVGLVFTVTEAQLLKSDDQVVNVMYEGLSEDDLAFNFLLTYVDNG